MPHRLDAAADELAEAGHGELAAPDHEWLAQADDDELAEVERHTFEVITGEVTVSACTNARKRTCCLRTFVNIADTRAWLMNCIYYSQPELAVYTA